MKHKSFASTELKQEMSARSHGYKTASPSAPVRIDDLKLDPRNPRVHSQKQVQELAQSIRTFGFLTPILINQNKQVIAGHGRLLAAKFLGMSEVPASQAEHLTDKQCVAYMIADNKLTENSTWDKQLLGEQLRILSEAEIDFSLDTLGFETGEIDLLIEGLDPSSDDGDAADALPQDKNLPQVTCPGDLWILGQNRIFCGNSLSQTSYAKLMDRRRAAIVFTDPPYNVRIDGHATGLGAIRHRNFRMAAGEMTEGEFTDFLAQAFTLMAQYSEAGSLHYVFMDWRHIREVLSASRHIYSELKNLCIWVKDNGGMGSLYRSQHELVFVFKNGVESHSNNVQLGKFGRYRTNVWNYPGANSFSRSTEEGNLLQLHPTVKPVALVADAILDCSKRGDIVLDPFLGSGTAVIAAERTGRVCHGIDLDPIYVDTTIRRWQKFTGHQARHATSGRTFVELEQEASSGTK
jgi:DNA modification methylase